MKGAFSILFCDFLKILSVEQDARVPGSYTHWFKPGWTQRETERETDDDDDDETTKLINRFLSRGFLLNQIYGFW